MILKIELLMYLSDLSNMRHFRSSNVSHETSNWELTVKIFTLKWGKDNKRATSSFRYVSEAIKKVVKNSPFMCVYVKQESVNKGKRVK